MISAPWFNSIPAPYEKRWTDLAASEVFCKPVLPVFLLNGHILGTGSRSSRRRRRRRENTELDGWPPSPFGEFRGGQAPSPPTPHLGSPACSCTSRLCSSCAVPTQGCWSGLQKQSPGKVQQQACLPPGRSLPRTTKAPSLPACLIQPCNINQAGQGGEKLNGRGGTGGRQTCPAPRSQPIRAHPLGQTFPPSSLLLAVPRGRGAVVPKQCHDKPTLLYGLSYASAYDLCLYAYLTCFDFPPLISCCRDDGA